MNDRLSVVQKIIEIINATHPVIVAEEKKSLALKKAFNLWVDKKILEVSINPNLSNADKLSMLNNYTESKM